MSEALVQALSAGVIIGVTTNLSLGPNNLMMLREGLVRGRVGLVSLTVCLSDTAMILGAAAATDLPIAQAGPSFRTAFIWCGVALLALMALRAFVTAFKPARSAAQAGTVAGVVKALLVVWVNPLTYLELFFAPAMVAQLYSGWARAAFFAGLLMLASMGCIFYPLLGSWCGQSWIGRGSTRALDFTSALILTGATVLTLRPLLL